MTEAIQNFYRCWQRAIQLIDFDTSPKARPFLEADRALHISCVRYINPTYNAQDYQNTVMKFSVQEFFDRETVLKDFNIHEQRNRKRHISSLMAAFNRLILLHFLIRKETDTMDFVATISKIPSLNLCDHEETLQEIKEYLREKQDLLTALDSLSLAIRQVQVALY